MSGINWHFIVGLLFSVGALGATLMGASPDDSITEKVPLSVRDNPASYKPSYVLFTGYHPRVTSSGGYRFGK
ncbi:MAG: hypothetical protein H6739_25800 [Alphaproteobacteria bacterium]|nr:hypothetical protein [Alphaproteobacteria bacterium]